MIFKGRVKPQELEARLADVDRVILNTSQHGCELIRKGAPTSEIDVDVEFLRHLYRRRNTILFELEKAGITEQAAYSHLKAQKEVQNALD